MDDDVFKCVMVVDEGLPVGRAVNTAGVLALTLGYRLESVIGPDVTDGSGGVHPGITRVPIPVLKASADLVRKTRLKAGEAPGVFVVDFTDAAQTSKTYEDYERKISARTTRELGYLGVALYGDKKAVNRLTGSLPLLR